MRTLINSCIKNLKTFDVEKILNASKHLGKEFIGFELLPVFQEFAIRFKGHERTSMVLFYEWSIRRSLTWLGLNVGVPAWYVTQSFALALSGISVPAEASTKVTISNVSTPVKAPKRVRYEVIETGSMAAKQVNFGLLAGRNMGKWITPRVKDEDRNPNALYSGIEQVTPESASVNYCAQIKLAWKSKMAIHGVTGATKKALPYIEDQYCNGTRTLTDLPTYVGDVDERVKVLYNNIDWKGFCATKKFSVEKCNVIKKIAGKVRGEHIVAYGMTELLPAQTHGLFNARLLDHNMRNAGLEFWMSVPALGDTLASKGLYQFTSYAIGHDGKGRAGASEVNAFLPKEYRISDSVVGPLGLKPTEHDQAAYLFIVYNIRGLINGINDKQLSVLDAVITEDRMDEMVEFFATSHHAPGDVRVHTRNWLSAGAKKPFKNYLKGRFVTYGLKTRHNLAGLRKFLVEVEEKENIG